MTQNERKPPPPPGHERRQHVRFEWLAQVQLKANDEVSLVPVMNISAGGLLVGLEPGTFRAVREGTEASVFLDATETMGEQAPTLTVEAVVVRINLGVGGAQATVAMKFKALSTEDAGKLSALLSHLQDRED